MRISTHCQRTRALQFENLNRFDKLVYSTEPLTLFCFFNLFIYNDRPIQDLFQFDHLTEYLIVRVYSIYDIVFNPNRSCIFEINLFCLLFFTLFVLFKNKKY
jgi:hypothetical protein